MAHGPGAAGSLEQFVADYAKGYDAYDAGRIAEYLFCPCLFLRQDSVTLLDTPAKITAFLEAGLRAYRDAGCVKFTALPLLTRRLGASRHGLVDVGWTMTDGHGKVVMEFQTTYNVLESGARWKIYGITRHDA
jgi:hypothetical protein